MADLLTWEAAVETLRRDPARAADVRDNYYDDPVAAAAARYHASAEWQAARRLLPSPGERALDVGAGRGILSYALARDGWATTALEPDASPIVGAGAIRALSRETGLAIDVVETWGEDLPFPDASFDLVVCRAVLHHARDLRDLCAGVARVLRPGGTFLALREHVVTREADIPGFQRRHPLHHLYGGEYAYTLAQYEGAIRAAGLAITRRIAPFDDMVNLFPLTPAAIKRSWATRLGMPALARVIPDALVRLRGARSNEPGRLYSFLCTKP